MIENRRSETGGLELGGVAIGNSLRLAYLRFRCGTFSVILDLEVRTTLKEASFKHPGRRTAPGRETVSSFVCGTTSTHVRSFAQS